MKQRISPEDLKTLTPSQQEKLREWWNEHRQKGDVFICLGNDFLGGKEFAWDGHNKPFNMSIPLISIGQCIELLQETTQHWHEDLWMNGVNIPTKTGGWEWKWCCGRGDYNQSDSKELIDALWDAVKSIL